MIGRLHKVFSVPSMEPITTHNDWNGSCVTQEDVGQDTTHNCVYRHGPLIEPCMHSDKVIQPTLTTQDMTYIHNVQGT